MILLIVGGFFLSALSSMGIPVSELSPGIFHSILIAVPIELAIEIWLVSQNHEWEGDNDEIEDR
jgi:asparagine N-glycosylation enzyme membrane subunit Stt3